MQSTSSFRAAEPSKQGSKEMIFRLPSQRKPDIFDSEDFNAIKFVNQIYPDESSLGDLDKFMAVLRKQIRSVDNEIFQSVRGQGGAHTRARQDLVVAQSHIAELFTRINEIQRKAEESEAMVQDICRDIRKLDYAKKHLTAAITALRRLAMLTAAVSELEAVCSRREQYRKCANLLEAVHQLMEYFQQYETIPKVRGLSQRLAKVQEVLQANVIDDFKILMGSAEAKLTPENLDRLASACLVVDALGPKVRDQLMDWLCEREMTTYQAIFSMSNSEAAKLDRFERRFLWFRSRLEEKKEQWAIFPEPWRVAQTLALTFCKITKAHLKRILSDDDGSRGDLASLIKTVVATNKFERDCAALFGGAQQETEDEDADAEGSADHMSASEARKRLERFRNKAKQEAAKKAAEKAGENKARDAQEAAKMAFEGSISEAFEDALGLYVAEEEKELMQHLAGVIREENERNWQPGDDQVGTRILESANKLFFRIRASLTRCVKMISRGQTLLGVAGAFKAVLSLYSRELYQRLPKTVTGATSAAPPYITPEAWCIRMGEQDEKVVCYILHTANFCRETLEGLTAAIQKDIKPALADKVDLSDEEGAFSTVSSACLSVLVLGINTRLDIALQEMARVRWDHIEAPGDDSVFVNVVRKVLLDCAPRLGGELDRVNFSFVCDKMARMFVPRLHEAVTRIKKISEKGTLQLSIDTDAIKRILLDFPKVSKPGDDTSDTMPVYVNYIEREMGRLINLVKVLQGRPDHLVDTFMLLMPANAQTPGEFQRVCEMKGLPKKVQADLMAHFQRRLAGEGPGSMAGPPGPGGGPALPTYHLPAPSTSNLGAFKLNMNRFTSELASTIAFPRKAAAAQQQQQHAGGEHASPGLGKGHHGRSGSSSSSGLEAIKDRTAAGFAKLGNVFMAANRMASAGSVHGSAGSGGHL